MHIKVGGWEHTVAMTDFFIWKNIYILDPIDFHCMINILTCLKICSTHTCLECHGGNDDIIFIFGVEL